MGQNENHKGPPFLFILDFAIRIHQVLKTRSRPTKQKPDLLGMASEATLQFSPFQKAKTRSHSQSDKLRNMAVGQKRVPKKPCW